MIRLRARFGKLGKVRWTSHRDVARMWERAFRRVNLPLAYSEGYTPRPKVSFGLALPTGHESVAEYLDMDLATDEAPTLDELKAELSNALPVGVDVLGLMVLGEREKGSLQEQVQSCTYRFGAVPSAQGADGPDLDNIVLELQRRAEQLLASDTLEVTRMRRGSEVTDDIRPGVLDVRVLGAYAEGDELGAWLEAELSTRPRNIRPAELLAALDQVGDNSAASFPLKERAWAPLEERQVRRTHQWISHDGARLEPIELPPGTDFEFPAATAALHALGRAS